MKKLAVAMLLMIATSASAQSGVQTVDVKANGTDIRDVLYQLFTQAKKSYVLQPGIRSALNLNLVGVDFDEALQVVCEAASLKAELQNGIYYIGRKAATKSPKQDGESGIEVTKPESVLPKSVLSRKVTTKMSKAPLKLVIAEFGKQTHLKFEVDPSVPAYRLDAFLTKLSLKQALDQITKAAKLEYEFTKRRSILIRPAEEIASTKP